MARRARARSLAARIHRLADDGCDELRVIDAFVVRLEIGLDSYGPLDLTKPRDWQREYDEELVDAAVYQACKRVADKDHQIAAIERGLDEIATAPAVSRTHAINFGESDRAGLDFTPTDELVHVTGVIDHASYCHATIPSDDRPDGGCICGAWEHRRTRPLSTTVGLNNERDR